MDKKEKIIKINPENPEETHIGIVARIIKKGGVIVFPTDTVYGLGANIFNKVAVNRIFSIKGRDFQKPLLVNIAKKNDLYKLVMEVNEDANVLVDNFWPGPLTLIFKRNNIVPEWVCGNKDKIALRIPNHPVALKIIKSAGVPITSTSANISGGPEIDDIVSLDEKVRLKVDCIVDAGKTPSSLSTILDLTSSPYRLARKGKVSKFRIEKILGKKIM